MYLADNFCKNGLMVVCPHADHLYSSLCVYKCVYKVMPLAPLALLPIYSFALRALIERNKRKFTNGVRRPKIGALKFLST